MNTGEHRFRVPVQGMNCVRLCFFWIAPLVVVGCTAKPNQANIELRKQLQTRDARIADLDRRHQADQATIRSLQSSNGATTTLRPERIDQLFTVSGLKLGRLTGGWDADLDHVGDEGIKIYVVPTDGSGDALKAAGSFVVELFDLNKQSNQRIGRWEFDGQQSRSYWNGAGLLYEYVLPCKWQEPPAKEELTVKVHFADGLTGRELEIQKQIRIKRPVSSN